jgi:polyferredoxin
MTFKDFVYGAITFTFISILSGFIGVTIEAVLFGGVIELVHDLSIFKLNSYWIGFVVPSLFLIYFWKSDTKLAL